MTLPAHRPSHWLRSALRRACLVSFALLASVGVGGCDDDEGFGVCANADCYCARGASCDIWCDAPPCHVKCEGDNDHCKAECANGDCECGSGSNCDFRCVAPPCHVDCAPNTSCAGECANGTCRCKRGSTCDFECKSGPCHVECEPGASCLLTCSAGAPNTRGCEFDRCDGTPKVCPDGKTVACNTECPPSASKPSK